MGSTSEGDGVRHEPRDLALQTHRQLIGVLGLCLPFLLYVVAGIRPLEGRENDRWELLESVSAYYYTGSVGIFVGVLFALAVYLLSYPGYKEVAADRWVGRIGGVAAAGVVLFPAKAPTFVPRPLWWERWMGVVHYVSAVALFLAFILFAVWLFRKSFIRRRKDRPGEKRWRDDICLACGIIMIVSIAWAGISSLSDRPIFVPEAIAILAFAVCWLVKGEARPVMAIIRRLP